MLIENVLKTELPIIEPKANVSKWHENLAAVSAFL